MTARSVSSGAWGAITAAGQAMQAATTLLDAAISSPTVGTDGASSENPAPGPWATDERDGPVAAAAEAAVEPLLDALAVSLRIAGPGPGEGWRSRLLVAIEGYVDSPAVVLDGVSTKLRTPEDGTAS